jgi:hypothetical protein
MANATNSVSTPVNTSVSTSGSSTPASSTSFLKGSYMNLPPATRGLITVVGVGILVYIGFKVFKSVSGTVQGKVTPDKANKQEDQGWNNEVERLNQNPATKATISAAQASSFANSCHAAIDGYQTDEDALYNVFSNLKNNADFALLMSAYGSREVSSGAWNPEPNFTGTLTGAITSECDATEKAKLNQILQSKGITNRV